MTDTHTALAETVEALAETNERRADLIARRDEQIAAALGAGATWVDVQRITGLSPRGVQLALERTRR